MTKKMTGRGGWSPVARILFGCLVASALTIACSSDGAKSFQDAGSIALFDAAAPSDGGLEGTSDAASEEEPDGSPTLCVLPMCSSTQVCCVDQHGHFPRCIASLVCAPPLKAPGED